MMTRELFHANWNYLSKRRFLQMVRDNERENKNRINHVYQIGDTVMCHVPPIGRKKTEPVAQGPFIINPFGSISQKFAVIGINLNKVSHFFTVSSLCLFLAYSLMIYNQSLLYNSLNLIQSKWNCSIFYEYNNRHIYFI